MAGFTFILSVAWILVLYVLVACSPAPDSEVESQGNYEKEPADLYEPEPDPDQEMLANGWRWGTLVVKVRIHQKGDFIQTTPRDKTESSWETSIAAEASQRVLVAPDLRVLVPADGDEYIRHSAFKSEPYFVSDRVAPAVVTGSVANRLRWSNLSPDANDFISLARVLDEAGEVVELDVERMHPSLYGDGYQVAVRLALSTRKVTTETAQPANNGPPAVSSSEVDAGEVFNFILYPVPNLEGLNDYPFWEPDLPAGIREQQRLEHLETLSLLKQIQTEAVPLLTDMRTGLRTVATKDSLDLTYEYLGDKQLAFMMGIESFMGKPSPNDLRISIHLAADP